MQEGLDLYHCLVMSRYDTRTASQGLDTTEDGDKDHIQVKRRGDP